MRTLVRGVRLSLIFKSKIYGFIMISFLLLLSPSAPSAYGWMDAGVPLDLSPGELGYLKDKKELVISVPADYLPYSAWKDSEGTGLAPSIVKVLGAAGGVALRYVPAEGIAGSLGQLARGEADICAVAISPDGSPAPGFIPYLNVPLQSVFHKDMRIRKRNKLIMAEVDGENFVPHPMRKENLKSVCYRDALDCLNALRSGEADFFVCDIYRIKSLIDTFVLSDLTTLTISRHNVDYGFMLADGANPRLASALKKAIASFSSTEVNTAISRYSAIRDVRYEIIAFVYDNPFEIICAMLSLFFVITTGLLTYARVRVGLHDELRGYEDSYRMLADTFGEAGMEYDYLRDRLTLFGRQHSMLDIPAVVDNFREQLASGRLRISLTPEEFEEMLNRGEAAKSYEAEFRCGMAGGGWNWFRMIYIVVSTEESHRRPIRLIGCLSDIESERRERDMLLDMGQKDALTGLLNRAAGEKQICEALNESALGSILLVIDIDHFKLFNDNFGHLCGDGVLNRFGASLTEAFGERAILCRWGGDEFVVFICCSEKDDFSVNEEIERLRSAMSSCKFHGIEMPVTLSIGGVRSEEGGSFEELFRAADGVLYSVKNMGRDGFSILEIKGGRRQ